MLHGLLVEDYSHIRYALSTLGMKGAPFAVVSRFAFILLGLSMIVFGWIVRQRSQGKGAASLAAMVLLFIHGLGRIAEGIFPWNPEMLDSMSNRLHSVLSAPGVFAMIVIPFAVLWAFEDKWPLRKYTAVTGGLFIVVLLTEFIGPAFGLFLPLGLVQRLAFAIWYLWILILSIYVIRRPDHARR